MLSSYQYIHRLTNLSICMTSILLITFIVLAYHTPQNEAACLKGQYYQIASSTCVNCQIGSYSSTVQATTCTECSGGTYTSSTGQSVCLTCPAGKGGSTCVACSAGTYKTSKGLSACVQCRVGTYSVTVGASSVEACLPCGSGTYFSNGGCQACPANTVSPVGSGYITDCMAVAGYYGLPGQAATLCPVGSYCPASTMKPIQCSSVVVVGSSVCLVAGNASSYSDTVTLTDKLSNWGSFEFWALVCWGAVLVLGIGCCFSYRNVCLYGLSDFYYKAPIIPMQIKK